jgi:DinB superfamily
MRTLITLVILIAATAAPLAADPMKQEERQRLVAHFEMTEGWLVSELEGLSAAQLKFRAAPDKWSIMDVVEHLAIAEPQYWETFQKGLAAPVTTDPPKVTDAAILWYGIDRTERNKTGEARVPKGRYDNVQASLGEFRKLRATMLDTAKTSQEDLRGHKLPGGSQDCYQWFLMISSHSQRHILQIREIKADPGYPKK